MLDDEDRRLAEDGLRRLGQLASWLRYQNDRLLRDNLWLNTPWQWTAGCAASAAGWAAQIPQLVQDGLRLIPNARGAQSPAYLGAFDWQAVESFFALTVVEAELLFRPRGATSRPVYVAETIDVLVAAKRAALDLEDDSALMAEVTDEDIAEALKPC